MKKVFLDTNFLLIPYQFKVDIFSEISRIMPVQYELYILDKTINELKSIIEDKTEKQKNKLAATLAFQFIKSKNISILRTDSNKSVDDILVDIADKDTIIATQDISLKKRLKLKLAGIIILRAKKVLSFQN